MYGARRTPTPYLFFLAHVATLLHTLPLAAAQSRPEGLVGVTSVCAERGVRAVECGSENPTRPDACCKTGMRSYSGIEDLYCSQRSGGGLHMRCWTAADLAAEGEDAPADGGVEAQEEEVDASNCGKDGDRVVECGADNPDRPPVCCLGYVCENGSVKCVKAEEGGQTEAQQEPVAQEVVPENDSCAVEDERSVACGALGSNKAECCFGHTCDPNSSKCVKIRGNFNSCGGYGDRVIDCGAPNDNDKRPQHCCDGYVCARDMKGGSDNDIHCVADKGNSELEPLDPIDPELQDSPIDVNSNIVVMGTTYESARDSEPVRIDVPKEAGKGDLLLMFIGGSAGSNKRPSDPSGSGWKKFIEAGREDLNLIALYKFFKGAGNDDETYRITDGKNTFVILTAVKGVDPEFPIIDAQAMRNSAPGKDGRAIAPSAFGVMEGAVFAAYVYDDPQVATIVTDGFHILSTSTTVQGDGMAAAVATTENTGYTGTIHAAGSLQKGGGNDVAMAVTIRPDGGPYDDPPADGPPAEAPVSAPTATLEADSTTAPVVSALPTTGPPTVAPTATSTPAPTDPPSAVTPAPTFAEPTGEPTLEPTAAETDEPTAPRLEGDQIDTEMIPSAATLIGIGGLRAKAAAAVAVLSVLLW